MSLPLRILKTLKIALVFTEGAEFQSARLSGQGRRENMRDTIQEIRTIGTSSTSPSSSSSSSTSSPKVLDVWLLRTRFFPTSIAWGYPFHLSCWEVLKSAYDDPVDIQAIFDICRSFPITWEEWIDFGHTYGDLYEGKENNRFKQNQDPLMVYMHKLDPFDAPRELRLLFDDPPQLKATRTTPISPLSLVDSKGFDPFLNLPLELIQTILPLLPSSDVVNLKQASRVFACVPFTDSFWRSRFDKGHELEHVMEGKNHFSSPHLRGRWDSVFISVMAIQANPAMLNRKRVWGLAVGLRDLIQRRAAATECHGSLINSYFEPPMPLPPVLDGMTWINANRYLVPPSKAFMGGSRALSKRYINFPSASQMILISIVSISGNATSLDYAFY